MSSKTNKPYLPPIKMKKRLPLHSTTLLLFFLVVFSCTKDDPIATKGNIYGKVTEEVTGQLISGAQVTVSGVQETTITSQNGSYQFSELPAGSYSVNVSKSGYVSDSKTLTVVPEKTTSGDFVLEKDLPTLSSNALIFNNETKTATLTLKNTRSGVMNFSVESSKPWLKPNPLSSAIQPLNEKIITVSVDFTNVPFGNYQEYIVINVGEASIPIPVQIDYIQPPYIEITKPTADQTYKMGEVMSVEWNSNLEGTIKIELLRFSSVFQTLTSDAVNNNGGNFTWTIPAIDPAAYQLKITSLENTTIESTSDAFNIVEGPTVPMVITKNPSELTSNTIQILGEIISLGVQASKVDEHGHVYSKNNPTPTISDSRTKLGETATIGNFTSQINNLTSGETYYIAAYAINTKGTAYGDVITLTTPANIPTVETAPITQITKTRASSGGTVSDSGGNDVIERGLCWGLNAPVTIDSNTLINDGVGEGTYSSSLTGLLSGTRYFVKAYAKNASGVGYGEQLEFTTDADIPDVSSTLVSSLSPTVIRALGELNNDGGAMLTSYGFVCASNSNTPTIGDKKLEIGNTVEGVFTADISELLPDTKYHIRAYATNAMGTAYGDVLSVTTKNGNPTVYTLSATTIDSNSAKTTGRIDSDGGAPLTSYGFVYSKENINPNLGDEKVTLGTSTSGTFEANISDLQPDTTYYVRAFATNDITTAFGDVLEVITKDGKPTVQTHYATTIDSNSAKTTGRIDSDGGAPLTSYGFVYSKQNNNPNLGDEKVTLGTSTSGPFEANLSELQPETTYYVRAFATNEITTAYGDVKTFTTEPGTYFGFDTPREGAELEAGSIFDITWSTNLSKRIILELWKDGNYEFEISNNVQASATSFSFNIPITQEVASHYTLRAVDYDSNEALGTSKMFKIVGLLRLVAPVQDTEHFIEEGVEVSWYSNYNTQFKIELYKGSQFLEELANNVDSNDGKYTLVREDSDHKYVGDDNYRIKLTDLTTNQIKYSGYFSVFEESTGLKFHNNDIKKTVTINGKRWTAEDVKLILNNYNSVYCYFSNTPETGYDNVPSGWRVASNEEWNHLEASLGMINSELSSSGDRTTGNVGFKLKTVACGGIDSYQFNASCGFPYGVFRYTSTSDYIYIERSNARGFNSDSNGITKNDSFNPRDLRFRLVKVE